ncbi:putative acyltransferase [Terriglobus roseus DSM 18391]|uniref:Putative acyltransferase n=2 Tax=Terriglobus roseus TaxID=392734 RepID=I3ZLM5_TERRK|nr:putative acyltransferase [Terriglobus roseus DSM 18391]
MFVVFYHGWLIIPSHRDQHDLLSRFIGLGYVSVSFFFMLSGFILAIVYLGSGKPVQPRRFFVSRFARIYPLYIAALLLDLPHFLHTFRSSGATSMHAVGVVTASVALVQAWSPSLTGLNIPGWSLSAEAFFYLCFPLIGPLLAKLRLRTSLVAGLLIYATGAGMVHALHGSGQTYSPLPHLYVFLLGINLATPFRWVMEESERRRALERSAPYLIVVSLAAFLAIPVFQLPISENGLQHGLLAPLFAVVIVALASGNRLIDSLLSPKWLVVLGEASFALYLIHMPIATMLRRPLQHYGTPAFLAYACLVTALSVLSLVYFETPCRLWILAKEKVRSRETQATSVLMQ